jgi:hypothetical protein
MDPWYVTGLVEGAGSFTYSRTDRNIVPYFALKLGREASRMLEEVQAYFGGLGRVYSVPAHPLPPVDRRRSLGRSHYFRVTRVDELDRVIQHFDDYPLKGPKAGAYAVWRELVALKRTAYRRPDREHIERLCVALSAAAPRRRGTRASE